MPLGEGEGGWMVKCPLGPGADGVASRALRRSRGVADCGMIRAGCGVVIVQMAVRGVAVSVSQAIRVGASVAGRARR